MLRRLFSRRVDGSLPNFLIIGAPKCGTTSLFEYMAGHPRIARPTRKEIQYFDENYERGLSWYRGHFPNVEAPQITGEATTAYLFAKDAPARAAALVPDAKIIAVLRDPVRRVISHYWHNERRGRVRGDFESYFREALSSNAGRETNQARQFINYPVQWGFYKEQIERWFAHFPRRQFLFIRFEDLVADTGAHMKSVFEFLELPPTAVEHGRIFNESPAYTTGQSAITRELADVYREHNAGLDTLIGPQFVWSSPPDAQNGADAQAASAPVAAIEPLR
ncbi:MAG TPA: sulfotransferase domain-containing protein [Rhizomicrobium sp.]